MTKCKEPSKLGVRTIFRMESSWRVFCTGLVKSVACELSKKKIHPDKGSCYVFPRSVLIDHSLPPAKL